MLKVAIICSLVASPLAAQKPTGFQKEYLDEISPLAANVISLANAIPDEKFSWRPAPGVRSVSEAYVHIAAGNYLLLDIIGVTPPPELYGTNVRSTADRRKAVGERNAELERTVTDKKQVIAMLKQSFEAVQAAFSNATPAELDRPVKFFGKDATVRMVYLRILAHSNEHVGQAIAYARINGVKPPWSGQ